MIRLTDVVKQLLIINAILFLVSKLPIYERMPDLALYYPGSGLFRPYQIVTYMFMHGNLEHFFFNMLMLATFGPVLETFLGHKRFLFFYLFCGIGAVLIHMAFQYWEVQHGIAPGAVVGASGALFGILVAFGLYFPEQQLMLLFPPIPVKAKYMVLFCIALELYFIKSGSQSNVAHFAHLGGALFGFLLVYYWRITGK